ncbi:MAG: hypothetical protein U0354_15500 [Candidatus Sericytochromatia bacterium]
MVNIDSKVNDIIKSTEYIDYVDNDLFEFASNYVKYVFEIYSIPKNRLTKTQVRGMLDISAHSINVTGTKLKDLCDNRVKKQTNEQTIEMWKELYNLFDISKDSWKQIIKINKKTPKEFIDFYINEELTKDEKNSLKNILFAYLMNKFCIHFYSEYIYVKAIKGERN